MSPRESGVLFSDFCIDFDRNVRAFFSAVGIFNFVLILHFNTTFDLTAVDNATDQLSNRIADTYVFSFRVRNFW